MTLPGFTAEASLQRTVEHYRLVAIFNVRPGGNVEPQIGRELACYFDCLSKVGPEEGWSALCAYYCTHR